MSIVRNCSFTMIGTGPLLFGRPVFDEKRDDESHAQFDERTWQQKCSTDNDGKLAISSTAVHKCIIAGAKWLSMKLEKNKTFTQRFVAGVFPLDPYFPIANGKPTLTPDDCEKLPLYVPSDGKPGGTKRVWRIFPRLKPGWHCRASFLVTDERITEEVFEKHIRTAGLHDGIGSMRIGKGGPNGMFTVEDFKMTDAEL